jgi:hypothetical protein
MIHRIKLTAIFLRIFTILILLILSLRTGAQTQFKVAENLYSSLSDSLTNQIIHSFDKLLLSIDNAQPDTSLMDMDDADLNRLFFTHLKGIGDKDTIPKYFQAQLINLYPVGNKQYMLTMSYTKDNEIGRIHSFLAKENKGHVVFANPFRYYTRYWKTATVGTATYFFPDTIDMGRAELFNQKNITMAQKLKLPVRNWEVYMCANFQEVLQLQGCLYESTGNGVFNSGRIMGPKILLTCMNDEDFSHDVLHIYASQIREQKDRNANGECGLAYYWGNAYHSGIAGKAPDMKVLLLAVRQYLQSHRDAKLLELFERSPDILAEYGYPHPIHINRILAGVICEEIEKQKGMEGIIELLKCGRGNNNLFKATEKLIGINRENFDKEVYKLIFNQ